MHRPSGHLVLRIFHQRTIVKAQAAPAGRRPQLRNCLLGFEQPRVCGAGRFARSIGLPSSTIRPASSTSDAIERLCLADIVSHTEQGRVAPDGASPCEQLVPSAADRGRGTARP